MDSQLKDVIQQIKANELPMDKLHLILFPEEYDHMCDSHCDAKDRRRGINPMSQAYQDEVNQRRAQLGVAAFKVIKRRLPPLVVTAEKYAKEDNSSQLISSNQYCLNLLAETERETIYLASEIDRLYFIGDVHAQKDKLDELLTALDVDMNENNAHTTSSKLVFIGDLIDNCVSEVNQHLSTLETVKTLVENNHAYCLLGNHEFNAVGWFLQQKNGEYLRPHNEKNKNQHQAFLNAVTEGSDTHKQWINWFKKSPLFLEFSTVKAIHACWDEKVIERISPYLNADNSLKDAHWIDAFNEQHELFELCEILLKGPERALPDGAFFIDKTGTKRTQERVQWWFEYIGGKPVVVGHYTLNESPKALTTKVACVDYNAAKGDNPLVALRVSLDAEEQTNFADASCFIM